MSGEIHGHCDARFKALGDAFAANHAEGLEVGSSVALICDGRLVVDLWGGWQDFEHTRPWRQDTIVEVFSAAKIGVILSMLLLVDRGLVDLDAPVATYWPAFAGGGKAAVTVRQAMSHRGGVPGFNPALSFEAMDDWDGVCANLAEQPHWFGGEDRLCYHFMTYGHLLGEIIRRVDGRRPNRFFQEEIGGPTGIDLHMGLSADADFERVAHIGFTSELVWPPFGEVEGRANDSLGNPDWTDRAVLSAEVPATGLTNARSLARAYDICAGKGVLDGRRLLSEDLALEVSRLQAEGPWMGGSMRMGLGVGLPAPGFPAPSETCAHWGGFGGSQALMDPVKGVAYGFTANNLISRGAMAVDPRWQRLWTALGEVMAGL